MEQHHQIEALAEVGRQFQAAVRRLPPLPPRLDRVGGADALYSRKLIRFHDLPLPKETHPWR
jgi:hypothetical protein